MDSLCHTWKIMDDENGSYQKQNLTEYDIYHQAAEEVWEPKKTGKEGQCNRRIKQNKTKEKNSESEKRKHLIGVN